MTDFEVHPVGTALRLSDILLDPSAKLLMTRTETISRRFEAMRMRWPDKAMIFNQQEMLCLYARKLRL